MKELIIELVFLNPIAPNCALKCGQSLTPNSTAPGTEQENRNIKSVNRSKGVKDVTKINRVYKFV